MLNIKGDLLSMKEMNRRLILDVIRTNTNLSRSEIAKKTKLNPSTVTRITAELINEGVISEVGHADSQGGRKPILLDLVPDVVHIIGINVERNSIIGLVSNLIGTVIHQTILPIKSYSKADIYNDIAAVIEGLMKKAAAEDRTLIGIGIAMHGLVDSDQGIILYPPAFGWKNLPIVDLLEKRFDLPVKLENNARAMALGESWFGAARGEKNFIALKVGHGIGSGIMLNGDIFRGVDFTAGEIGHTYVTVDGPLCDCGNYGCLETLASIKALTKRAQRSLKEGVASEILTLAGNPETVTHEHIFTAAQNNDPLALHLLQDAGRYLGMALANITNLLNPAKILIGGEILAGLEFVLPTLAATVKARAMEIPAQSLAIEPIELGMNSVAIGAVTLILEDIFKPGTSSGKEFL